MIGYIFLYVTDELSYDKYHSDLDRIYRVAGTYPSKTSSSASAMICAPVGQVLRDNFPQVEKVGQVLSVSSGLVKYQENMFYEANRMYANTELFSVLTIPFLKGDPTTALDRPATIVISERMAKKYFGSAEPIGKTVSINSREYEITGVAADSPANTHFKYDFILSLKTLEGRYPFSRWFLANLYTYVKLKPNINIEAFSTQLAQVAETHAKQYMEEGDVITYFIQPVADIHLHSHLRNEKEPPVNPIYLYIFSAVGVLILLIASVNFMNLSTVKEFGWNTPDEAIGKRVQGIGDPAVIIGVVDDFHYRGLQSVIEPLILYFRPLRFNNISLTVNTENLNETISFVKQKWQELFPGNPFEYSFLDEDFDRQYRAEEQFGKLFSTLTFLGLFIACLVLLGLASFTAEQRTKEIGICKTLGASVTSIIALLASEFVKWVGMGTIIAWPVAFFVMQNWLTNFAYRISLGWLPFVAAASLAAVIAMLTVSYQAIKAATANPVDALKYE